jgi:signal transduction histidine kinase
MSNTETVPGKYAVLYVDDEEQALKYFRKGLEKDFRTLTAPSAAQGMAILEQEAGNIGVVITDQRMPGQSGVEFLTEIRKRWPAIVRILVTAYTDIDSAVSAVNAGAVFKYITKPADFPLLRQTLLEALALHRETLHRNAMEETLRKLEEQRRATELAEADRELLQQKLIAASREAGRAEVATGILHNVGNVLNSMNVSASVVNNTLEQSRVENLCKSLSMLEEHSTDLASFITTDERGQRLPGYLIKIGPVLKKEQELMVDAMSSLKRNIDHIAQVVQVQQSHAKPIMLLQYVKAADLMDEAIHVSGQAIEKQSIQIERDYPNLPLLEMDQHRVLQILFNLVSNAAKAIEDAKPASPRIVCRIVEKETAAGPLISFQVIDNGTGMSPESLTKAFNYGFTTRKEGHGFGLHSSANAAREMGGSLVAVSDGLGKGAVFILELPMRVEKAAV